MQSNAKIIGTASYLPSKVLTNFDLEKTVDTTDEWIRVRTGIRERRIASEIEASSDLGLEAAKSALGEAKVDPRELDLIIVTTVTPDMTFPSTACIIQDKLGAINAAAMDIAAACTGFIYGLSTAHCFITAGQYSKVLVVATETLSKITDWEDRSTCVLLGDGAAAAVLDYSDRESAFHFVLGATGSEGELLYLPGGGSRNPATHKTVNDKLHFLKMKGNELFKLAVRLLVDAGQKVMKKAKVAPKDIDLFIPHQANIRIIEACSKRLHIPREKVYVNIDRCGNTSAASIPIALDEAVREGRIKPGDLLLLDAFGGGLTWGACLFRW